MLERAEAEQPLTGYHLVIRAQAFAVQGRCAEAREAIERALSLLHPEELVAEEARQLLAKLAPSGERT